MQEQLQARGARVAIQDILGLPDAHPLSDLVVAAYESWLPPGAA